MYSVESIIMRWKWHFQTHISHKISHQFWFEQNVLYFTHKHTHFCDFVMYTTTAITIMTTKTSKNTIEAVIFNFYSAKIPSNSLNKFLMLNIEFKQLQLILLKDDLIYKQTLNTHANAYSMGLLSNMCVSRFLSHVNNYKNTCDLYEFVESTNWIVIKTFQIDLLFAIKSYEKYYNGISSEPFLILFFILFYSVRIFKMDLKKNR